MSTHSLSETVPTASGVEADAGPDGRTERRLRNRAAVLDAVIEMFAEGIAAPSMDVVADRAEVSVRSVYRYFETREQLVRAALERLMEHAAPHLIIVAATDGDLAERVRSFVHQRVTLFVQFAPLARVAITIGQSDPLVKEVFEFGRDSLRQHFLNQFDAELHGLSPREQTLTTVLATLPLQFHAFDYLYETCGFDADDMEEILVDQLLLHLSGVSDR